MVKKPARKLKKYTDRVPSVRMKKTLDNFVANRGKSMKKAMTDAGFSKAYCKNSGQLLKSRSWQELTSEFLGDDLLATVHAELLKNKDWRARDAGLDKAYKVKGKYAPDQLELTKREYQDLSTEDLIALRNKLKNFLQKK